MMLSRLQSKSPRMQHRRVATNSFEPKMTIKQSIVNAAASQALSPSNKNSHQPIRLVHKQSQYSKQRNSPRKQFIGGGRGKHHQIYANFRVLDKGVAQSNMDANMDEYLASTLVAHSVNITRSNFNPILSSPPTD